VVLDDADLAKAVKATVGACFLNSGQTCSAITRLVAPASRIGEAIEIAQEVAAGFKLGDPFDPATRLGPVVSAKQRDIVRDHIRRAAADGATLVAGGEAPPEGLQAGYFVKPTIFAEVDPNSALAQEEVFGPVLAVLAARDEDDAVAQSPTIRGMACRARFGQATRSAQRASHGAFAPAK